MTPLRSQSTRPWFLLGLLLCPLVACQCECGTVVTIDGGALDAGKTDGGHDAGALGGGSGGGAATGGGFVGIDAGDVSQDYGAGTFTVDGGSGGVGSGVKLDPSGNIVLSQGSSELAFMWIANNDRGWVSKYDTRTGKEIGRYLSVINRDCAGSAGPPCAGAHDNGLTSNTNYNPSRTAIDLNGDLWVANRAADKQGSVTKIANDVSGCIDRNGNHTIETSRDLNGDGQISTDPADGEMRIPSNPNDPLLYDECVLFTTPVGGAGSEIAARALAVSASTTPGSPGDIWVGVYREQRVYKLSGLNGQILPVNAANDGFVHLGFGPYGAIVDRQQRLWVVAAGTPRLALIDARTGALIEPNIDGSSKSCGSYGIGIDGKSRVWLAGWLEGASACRYDHSTHEWTKFTFSNARSQRGTSFGLGRGIAVDVHGTVYMSGYGDAVAQVIRFDSETGAIVPFGAAAFIEAGDTVTSQSIGVALDSDDNPWVNNQSGNAMRVDKTSGTVLRTAQQAAGLYTYSDFTGYQLRNYTAPLGSWTKDFMACAGATWKQLSWSATVPANTRVQLFVRAADTVAGLSDNANSKYGGFVTSPVDLDALGVPRSTYLRVFVELTSTDGQSTPVFKSLNLSWNCFGGIN